MHNVDRTRWRAAEQAMAVGVEVGARPAPLLFRTMHDRTGRRARPDRGQRCTVHIFQVSRCATFQQEGRSRALCTNALVIGALRRQLA